MLNRRDYDMDGSLATVSVEPVQDIFLEKRNPSSSYLRMLAEVHVSEGALRSVQVH